MAGEHSLAGSLEGVSRSSDMHIGEHHRLLFWEPYAIVPSVCRMLCTLPALMQGSTLAMPFTLANATCSAAGAAGHCCIFSAMSPCRVGRTGATSPPCDADGRYDVWLVLDTNTLMQSSEELLAFHSASKDSILPRSGAFRSIDLDIKYYVPQAVIRELDYRKSEGNADGKHIVGASLHAKSQVSYY